MLSFLDDPHLKADMLVQITAHEQADQIIQGSYGCITQGVFRGCAVGCSIHSLSKIKNQDFSISDHALYETELGIPEWLARLEDSIFEGLSQELATTWPRRFIEAIPIGIDLDLVKWKFSAYLLSENIDRTLALDISDELKIQVVYGIRDILHLHETAISTGIWEESAARSAESAARSAESAARSAAFVRYSEKLLEFLRNAE